MRSISLGLMVLLGAACSATSDGTTATTPDSGTVTPQPDAGTTSDADADAGPSAPPVDTSSGRNVPDALAARVIGFYAIRSVVASIQDAPVIGKTPSVATATGVGEIKRAGTGLTITESGCHVDLSASSVVKPTVPDALPRSVPAVTYPFRLWEVGQSVKFVRDPVAAAIGVKLVDVENDPLPANGSDPRIWDQDLDGNPGVTVKMSGSLVTGDIFVVQRQRSLYTGELSTGDKLGGLLRDMSQQATVGATSDLLKQNVPTTPDPDVSKSTVTFVKLTMAYDCARVMSEAATLFPAK